MHDQDPLAWLELGHAEQQMERGRKMARDDRRLRERQLVWNRDDVAGWNADVFSIATPAMDPDVEVSAAGLLVAGSTELTLAAANRGDDGDTIADLRALDARASRLDETGRVDPEDEWETHLGVVGARSDHQIQAAIDRYSVDPHEHVARARRWGGDLFEAERLGTAVAVEDDGFHERRAMTDPAHGM